MKSGAEIRELTSISEQASARAIFDITWPLDGGGTEITSNLMQAMVHSGAYLAGAFHGAQMVGAAFAFPSLEGELHLHSHMAAAIPGFRDQGIGYALKLHQYQWAKERGYKSITWTFDPLVRRNAKFNITKLGADIAEYLPNFYGEMEDELNAGDETDRIMARWDLSEEHPQSRQTISAIPSGATVIAIPEDIVEMRSIDMNRAIELRRHVRAQFLGVVNKKVLLGFSNAGEYVFGDKK